MYSILETSDFSILYLCKPRKHQIRPLVGGRIRVLSGLLLVCGAMRPIQVLVLLYSVSLSIIRSTRLALISSCSLDKSPSFSACKTFW